MPINHEELDADTIQEALWGEPPQSGRAFVRLYEHYEERVRYAVARAAHRIAYFDNVEELRQDVWARLLDKDRKLLRYFRPEVGPLGPFIARLAYQQALQSIVRERRKSGRELQAPVSPEWLQDEQTSHFAAEHMQSELVQKLLERASAELEPIDLLILREVHLGQRRSRDVAVEHGINPQRLYKRNERLRKRLAAWCEELVGGPVRPGDGMTTALAVLILVGLGGV